MPALEKGCRQDVLGSYANKFSETGSRQNFYVYDKSNRLLKAERKDADNINKGKLVNSYNATYLMPYESTPDQSRGKARE